MTDRYSGAPEVFDYNRNSYESYNSHILNTQPHVASDPRYPHQQDYFQTNTSQSNNYRSTSQAPSNRGSNFDNYKAKLQEYKYNLFSLVDEPWNRCCEIGKCGNCPGNECIARRTPKLDWI